MYMYITLSVVQNAYPSNKYVGVGLTATLLASRTVVSGVSWPDTCDETILKVHVATMQMSQMRAAILQSLKIKRTED